MPMIRENFRAESRGRKGESAARSAFGIKASRVIDWCSGGYTQRHVPTVASTDVAAVCAWELLKAERIRQEKAAAVKKGAEHALPSFVPSGCHGQSSLFRSRPLFFLRTRTRSRETGRDQTFRLKDPPRCSPIRALSRLKLDNWDVAFAKTLSPRGISVSDTIRRVWSIFGIRHQYIEILIKRFTII